MKVVGNLLRGEKIVAVKNEGLKKLFWNEGLKKLFWNCGRTQAGRRSKSVKHPFSSLKMKQI